MKSSTAWDCPPTGTVSHASDSRPADGSPLGRDFRPGACVGSLVNLAADRLAWHPRGISPWFRRRDEPKARGWFDRLPIVGWTGLRREASRHGAGFWVRPMLVELAFGLGLAALYHWEVGRMGLYPAGFSLARFPDLLAAVHSQYLAHAILFALMLAASLIDIDERTIPDAITVPGTLVGLLLAALVPYSLLPDVGTLNGTVFFDFLRLSSPVSVLGTCPPLLAGFPNAAALAIAIVCYWAWCAALLPRSWYTRHGWRRAMQLSAARMVRSRSSRGILLMAILGAAAIAAIWGTGGQHWDALLTALVGMAASGAWVWLIRIIGQVALGREAMGFGDVTLMAMIGAFLGWQPGLIVFFSPRWPAWFSASRNGSCAAARKYLMVRSFVWRP